jgi:16S rRNA (cytidine1402-2'-O)-methyltransferase
MLYIVPGPIGNLSDITYRAIEILKSVDLILAEDTRQTSKLLRHYSIDTPLRAYHAFNEHKVLESFISQMLSGVQVALMSDAGTPGISDPGFLLIREAMQQNVEIISLPGPTALITAVVASGIPCDRFYFEGFLPHKKGRQTRLKDIAIRKETIVLYESPYRLIRCLKELSQHCGGERQACVAREISKIHETFHRGSLDYLISEFESLDKVRGEIVVIVAGA